MESLREYACKCLLPAAIGYCLARALAAHMGTKKEDKAAECVVFVFVVISALSFITR